MFFEYALEPRLLNNWKDYRFFIGHFGAPKGRMISRYPRKWKSLVKEAAKNAGEREFLQIVESLERIDNLVLSRFHEWKNDETWFKNAVEEHTKRPFRAIVASENPDGSPVVLCGDDLDPTDDDPPEIWAVRTSIQVVRKAADMAACVAALLRHCKEVLFIDPHFDPANYRHREPLRAFLAEIAKRPKQQAAPTRMEYHTSNKNRDSATFSTNLRTRIRPMLPPTSRLKVVRWDVGELHNRFIVTDRGGVMFGTGLDQDDSADPGEDTVTLLDNETCRELFENYSSASKKLTWLGDTYEVAK